MTQRFTLIICQIALLCGTLPSVLKAENQPRLSDTTIRSIVEYRLHEAGMQRDNKVAVMVDDHVVTLSGTVRSVYEKRRAEQIARSAPDVSGVENKLKVEGGRESQQDIANDVTRSIRSHAFFDVFDWVEGDVRDGIVTLRGAVREPWRRKEYERLAESASGVIEVRNEIEVLPNSSFDDQIRVAAARAIYGDSRFVRYANRSLPPIHIIVNNGKVFLKGAVANQMEKQLAETLVRTEVLSFEVVNELTVDSQNAGRG
jgi:hyperosmotically inducible protein